MKYDYLLPELKQKALVFDIETSAHYPDGREVSIRANYEDYIKHAKVKWVGLYSFKEEKGYICNCYKKEDVEKVLRLMEEHEILVSFNGEEFDYPILKNNGYCDPDKYYINVDMMQILGKSIHKNRSGFPYKDRGSLMNYKFKNNSLKTIAKEMGLETQKGDIDYKIFAKDVWTSEEENEIKKYLKADVLATKEMFQKTWDFWLPFTDLLDVKHVKNLSWIRNSIASLTYKCACTLMGVEPSYSEKTSKKEEMGGFVLEPQVEEETNVFICDWASLYPHIYCSANLFAETNETDGEFSWHGNDLFKVKGYYNISKQHQLNVAMQDILKKRIELKKISPDDPMIYAYKIYVNSYYGASRSAIFEQIHTPNCGHDCCYLGQQINGYSKKRLEDFGFKVLYQDTDSCFCKHNDKEKNNKDYLNECLEKIVSEIKDNLPFKVPTFNIDVEKKADYIMFPYTLQPIQDEDGNNIKKKNRLVKKWKGNKKNYLFIYNEDGEKKVKMKGLPIIKDGATHLGITIYNEVLKPIILKNNKAKFSEKFIKETVNEYLKDDKIMQLVSREFKCKPFHTYKITKGQTEPTGLNAQISKHYFNGNEGVINLIKNKKIGKVGKGSKYCTVKEAIDNKLTVDDLNLDKLWKELHPFIEHNLDN